MSLFLINEELLTLANCAGLRGTKHFEMCCFVKRISNFFP